MIGHGVAHGAVTFLNALFTGTGAAAGIDLATRATVDARPARAARVTLRGSADTPFGRAVAAWGLGRWGGGEPVAVTIEVASDLPVARGLKSSSAFASALLQGVAAAVGHPAPPEDVARECARVARASGQSATGAFDDALAGLVPGIHVTDNTAMRRLRSVPIPPDWRAVVLVPPDPHPPSPAVVDRFHAVAAEAEGAAAAATEGDVFAAMARNSALVEGILGYPYGPLRAAAADAGALGSGVSGLGPAFVAVVPTARVPDVARRISQGPGTVRTARFLGQPAATEGPS
jgi:shikimate kinase